MDTLTITLVLLALVISLSVSYFQYFYRRSSIKEIYLLFLLRSISVFGLLILLINPRFEKKQYVTVKPNLYVAVDNSSSISFTKQDSTVRALAEKIKNSKELNQRFNIEYFTFGSSLKSGTTLNFDESKTNIFEVLQELNTLSKEQVSPIVLISDGNQTLGNTYSYFQSYQEIYPFVIGDTTQLADLELYQVNVNSYTFLNNTFPVEVFLIYKGDKNIKTEFTIESQNSTIYKKAISFSKNEKSVNLTFNLPANRIGNQQFKARIRPFDNEKNTINNNKNFSVEVIDEQTKIALIYDVMHPDVGMLKKSIESNKQRKVELLDISLLNSFDSSYSAYILYQPNIKFQNVFKHIDEQNINVFLITGRSTDWNFINKNQNFLHRDLSLQFESYYPSFNANFNIFQVEDIGFSEFPPLEGYYGDISFSSRHTSILTQFINGIETEAPLLLTFDNSNQRGAVLFGENIWKWRSLSYVQEKSFYKFDNFLSSIIQYLTLVEQMDKIELDFKPFYYSDEAVKIKAMAYDFNFNFNTQAELVVKMGNNSDELPFYSNGRYFEVNLGELNSGSYNFKVLDKQSKEESEGVFTIIEYSIEQELTQSNRSDLEKLALNSGGEIFSPYGFNIFVDFMMNSSKFTPLQKEKTLPVTLIDWKWLLIIIIVSLAFEWFIRKYRGLI